MIVLPYQRQPVGSIRPNRSNSLLDRVTGLWIFSQPYNLITGEPTVLSGAGYFTAAQQGIAARTVATTGRIQLASDSRNLVPTSGGFTVALHYRKIGAAAATAGFGLDATTSALIRAGTHFPFSDGTLYWDFGGNTAGTSRLTAASLTYGDDFWVFTTGPNGMEIWQNGIRRARQSSSANWFGSSNPYLLGMHGTATNADDAECAIFLTAARQWSPAECAEWCARPWQVAEPVVLYVKAGSGVTGGAGSLSASGTLSGVGAATVAADGSLSATGTIAGVGAATVAGAGSLNATGTLSAVGADGSSGTTDGAGNLSASGTLTGVGASINAASGSLSASGTLSAVGADAISAGAGSLWAQGTINGVSDFVPAQQGGGWASAYQKRLQRKKELEARRPEIAKEPAAVESPSVPEEPQAATPQAETPQVQEQKSPDVSIPEIVAARDLVLTLTEAVAASKSVKADPISQITIDDDEEAMAVILEAILNG